MFPHLVITKSYILDLGCLQLRATLSAVPINHRQRISAPRAHQPTYQSEILCNPHLVQVSSPIILHTIHSVP